MAGTFSKSTLPKRPGAYFNFQAAAKAPSLTPTTGTVALAFEHTWGPANTVVELNSFSDFLKYYGPGTITSTYPRGYAAVRDCFKGEGISGFGGASKIWAQRVMNSGAVAAAKTLQNTTPAAAITLTALYKGTYGNNLSVSSIATPSDPTNKIDLIVFINNVEVERFTFAKTNITDLAAQINGTSPYSAATASDWLAASGVTSGVALALVGTATAGSAMTTAGTDGTTVAGDYTAALTAFEPFRFSVLAIDNMPDSGIGTSVQASLKTWQANLNTKGKRFTTVIGGAAAETMATAVARSALNADYNIVNIGCGTYLDDTFGNLSTAQLVPRLAGIIAQRGENAEITFARLQGLSLVVGASEADLISAIQAGTVAIGRDSHPTAPLRIELGVTTFTDPTNTATPVAIYSNIKFVRTMQGIETELTEWAEQNVIGKLQINQSTRDYVRGQMAARLSVREKAGIIQAGWTVDQDASVPTSATDNFVALAYSLTFGRGLQQILNTVTVG